MSLDKEPHNPYSPPESSVEEVVELTNNNEVFIPGGRSVQASEGVNWIREAWNFITPKLGMWVLLGLILFGITITIQCIPIISLLFVFFIPIFNGGIMLLCEKQRTTGECDIGLIFAGFQKNPGQLIGVGAVTFGMSILSIIAMFVVGGSAFTALVMGSQDGNPSGALAGASGGLIFIAFLLMFAINMVGYALTWFAPALIVVHNLSLGQALSMSLSAVKKNLLPGLIYFIVVSIIMVVAMIPLFLGLLLAMPLFFATYYTSYRSLFIANK